MTLSPQNGPIPFDYVSMEQVDFAVPANLFRVPLKGKIAMHRTFASIADKDHFEPIFRIGCSAANDWIRCSLNLQLLEF